jgi:protein-L-isoaspartate(D-aspartate) O-methyltransferase
MDFAAARLQMTDQQVRAAAVLDPRVLAVLAQVPREEFVPPGYRDLACADLAIPLPCGQHMLTPTLVGQFLQTLDLAADDAVLEIGTGSGFVSACLASLAASVRSLEIHAPLAEAARGRLRALGYPAVEVQTADATGITPTPLYDAVLLTASLPLYDERYESWLKVGGRLMVVVGEPPAMEALLVRRAADGRCLRQGLFETCLDALIHARAPTGFSF